MSELDFIVFLSNASQTIQEKFRSDHSRGQFRREFQDCLMALDELKRKKMAQLPAAQRPLFSEPVDP